MYHGVVVTPGAGQLHGGGALRVEVAGVFAQISAVSSAGWSAPRYSAMRNARSETRILGVDGLGHVVVQGNVEAVALAGEFGAQQAEDGFFAERAVNLGLFRRGRAVFDRRVPSGETGARPGSR
jgi:hypothetical protein